MLEVGWSEILVIALILIIVVGPKDLPGMLRTFGRMASRVRGMANEFKGQFDEAIREADLDDVRKGLNEVNKLNPGSSLREAINPLRQLGQDIKSDLQKASDMTSATPAVDKPVEPPPAAPVEPVATAAAAPVVQPPVQAQVQPVVETPPSKPKTPRKKAVATDAAVAVAAVESEVSSGKTPSAKSAGAVEPGAKKPAARKKPAVADPMPADAAPVETKAAKAVPRRKAAKTGDA